MLNNKYLNHKQSTTILTKPAATVTQLLHITITKHH